MLGPFAINPLIHLAQYACSMIGFFPFFLLLICQNFYTPLFASIISLYIFSFKAHHCHHVIFQQVLYLLIFPPFPHGGFLIICVLLIKYSNTLSCALEKTLLPRLTHKLVKTSTCSLINQFIHNSEFAFIVLVSYPIRFCKSEKQRLLYLTNPST